MASSSWSNQLTTLKIYFISKSVHRGSIHCWLWSFHLLTKRQTFCDKVKIMTLFLTRIRPTCNFYHPKTASFVSSQMMTTMTCVSYSCIIAREQNNNCCHTNQLIHTSCLHTSSHYVDLLNNEASVFCLLKDCERDRYLIVILPLSFQRWRA